MARPKMVLIGDIVGDDEDAVARRVEVVRICNARGGEGFVAVSGEMRKILARPCAHGRDLEACPMRSSSTGT